MLACGAGLLLALAGPGADAARSGASAAGRAVARRTSSPPVWRTAPKSAHAGQTLNLVLDPTTARACGVAVLGPYEGQQVSWNFKTSGLLLKIALHTRSTATPGRWSVRASCGMANGKQPQIRSVSFPVRGNSGARGLLLQHRDLRVVQIPLITGTPAGKTAGKGAGSRFSDRTQCVAYADERRSDIYDAAVAAGVPRGGLRAHPSSGDDYVWNAKYWAENAARAHIPEGPDPVPGAIAVFTSGKYGHVAYVESVNRDGSFNVTERNKNGCNCSTGNTSGTYGRRDGLIFIYGGPAGSGPAPAFDPAAYQGHIVKQDNGKPTSWLVVDAQGHRNWIPDGGTFECLVNQGHPVDTLSAGQLQKLPDQNGVWAHCTPPKPTTTTVVVTTTTTPTTTTRPPTTTTPAPTQDRTAPSTPGGLSASGATTSSINFSWNASSDNVGVAGYFVYANDNHVANASGTSVTVGGLACGTTYTLAVDAYDAAANHSAKASISAGTAPCPLPTYSETAGGVAHTWTNYSNAGGNEGPTIAAGQTVQIACKVQGFRVADGNTWWYRIAQAPWNGQFYVSADAFYNNGHTSGSLSGTPFVDPAVRDC